MDQANVQRQTEGSKLGRKGEIENEGRREGGTQFLMEDKYESDLTLVLVPPELQLNFLPQNSLDISLSCAYIAFFV